MTLSQRSNIWVIWLTFVVGLVLSVLPMPVFFETGRPLWLALLLSYWTLYFPHRVGMTSAWLLGLALDVLCGTLLGQNALVLALVSFLVQLLQQRLRISPIWKQCLMLWVILGLAQLLHLWLYVLTGNRPPPTLLYLLPVLVSTLLWPWLFAILRGLRSIIRVT